MAPPCAAPAFAVPVFTRAPAPALPPDALFLSCAPKSSVCAFRQNASERVVVVTANGTVVARVAEADDPRVFTHQGRVWIMNNNFFRKSLLLLRSNGTVARELALPLAHAKNLVPLSWLEERLFLLDLQAKLLWPTKLHRRDAVELARPREVEVVHDAADGACALPDGCAVRGGTAGLRVPRTKTAVGAGHCTGTGRNPRTGRVGLRHASFWWQMDLERMRLHVQPLCLSGRLVVDPTTLLIRLSGSTANRSVSFELLTAETDRAWNSHKGQRYYTERYVSRAVRLPLPRRQRQRQPESWWQWLG
jgi:hypothetical protein